MTPTYSLRPATRDDFETLYTIHAISLREPVEATWGWDDADQRQRFAQNFAAAPSQVVQVGDEVAGHLVVEWFEDEVFLARMALHPDWQGRGIGTCIVKDVVRAAREAGRPTRLHVLRANARARALYERLGFAVFDTDDLRVYMRIE